jgi:hypothetical protein
VTADKARGGHGDGLGVALWLPPGVPGDDCSTAFVNATKNIALLQQNLPKPD